MVRVAICFLGAAYLLYCGLYGAIAGKTFGKYGYDRVGHPMRYWATVVCQFVVGALFLAALPTLIRQISN